MSYQSPSTDDMNLLLTSNWKIETELIPNYIKFIKVQMFTFQLYISIFWFLKRFVVLVRSNITCMVHLKFIGNMKTFYDLYCINIRRRELKLIEFGPDNHLRQYYSGKYLLENIF